MKAPNITDRAKRYRAQRNAPPGPKQCNFCGKRRNIDIDHVTGDESDGDVENLIYLCRVCNTTKGIVQARNRIGVRTRQYNGSVPTFAKFRQAAWVLLGKAHGDAGEATALIRATPPARRARYAEKMANPSPTFEQYLHAVSIHRRGAHDEGGRIIHATPKSKRSEYASKIAEFKRQRRAGDVPF